MDQNKRPDIHAVMGLCQQWQAWIKGGGKTTQKISKQTTHHDAAEATQSSDTPRTGTASATNTTQSSSSSSGVKVKRKKKKESESVPADEGWANDWNPFSAADASSAEPSHTPAAAIAPVTPAAPPSFSFFVPAPSSPTSASSSHLALPPSLSPRSDSSHIFSSCSSQSDADTGHRVAELFDTSILQGSLASSCPPVTVSRQSSSSLSSFSSSPSSISAPVSCPDAPDAWDAFSEATSSDQNNIAPTADWASFDHMVTHKQNGTNTHKSTSESEQKGTAFDFGWTDFSSATTSVPSSSLSSPLSSSQSSRRRHHDKKSEVIDTSLFHNMSISGASSSQQQQQSPAPIGSIHMPHARGPFASPRSAGQGQVHGDMSPISSPHSDVSYTGSRHLHRQHSEGELNNKAHTLTRQKSSVGY